MRDAIVQRWQEVLGLIGHAAQRAGRSADSVRLVAVSKTHGPEAIRTLFEAGQTTFGENYVQEALKKMQELPDQVEWHCIGHLQTNKAKAVVGKFALIQSVGSVRLARSLQDQAQRLGVRQNVLMQVNLGGETQKSGILTEEIPALAEILTTSSSLSWQGLMLMPPFFDDPEGSRPFFAGLRELAETLRQQWGLPLPELSMGMTGDFQAAIEEGATLVRVGTKIFGARV